MVRIFNIRQQSQRWLAVIAFALCSAVPARAGFSTTVPVTEASASNIAVSNFPISLALDQVKLLLTEPQVKFLTPTRIGIRVNFQAYDHRPEAGIALSETGLAMFSGRVTYDRQARQVLLHDARLEELVFDRKTETARQFSSLLRLAWSENASDPIRTELPPHPYLQPFKENIDNILYDGHHISFVLVY